MEPAKPASSPSESAAGSPAAATAGPRRAAPGPLDAPQGRSDERIAAEAEAAKAAFFRAARAPAQAQAQGPRSGRSAVLQAFFTANAGRSLLPGNEASGALAPQLKSEEP